MEVNQKYCEQSTSFPEQQILKDEIEKIMTYVDKNDDKNHYHHQFSSCFNNEMIEYIINDLTKKEFKIKRRDDYNMDIYWGVQATNIFNSQDKINNDEYNYNSNSDNEDWEDYYDW